MCIKSQGLMLSASQPRIPVPDSRLPLDVYRCLIDTFREDQALLCCCALVCRSWAPWCQYHLFSHVYLSSDSQGNSGRRDQLAEILHTSPHIIEYIQSVTFMINTYYGVTTVWTDISRGAFDCARFPNLQSLTLRSFRFSCNTEIVDIIRELPLLKRLSIDNVHVRDGDSNTPPTPVPPCHSLEVIRFTGITSFQALGNGQTAPLATRLMECGALASLTSLDISTGMPICRGWISLLPDIGARLSHCGLNVFDPTEVSNTQSVGEAFREHHAVVCDALRFCPSLHSLRIKYDGLYTFIHALYRDRADPAPRLSPFFFETLADTLSRPEPRLLQHLKRLSFSFLCSVESLSAACLPACERLGHVLVADRRYPSFQHLDIDFEEPMYHVKPPRGTLQEREAEASRLFAVVQDAGVRVDTTVKESSAVPLR
ncbi:hypothetical protein C8Q80DRAFT_436724 [Daedaleopsis nitida]|nr:hypothetical protein C8Q80DRAFT_436724 [Daedaleopsis nitida]